jgi:hypothetical protein
VRLLATSVGPARTYRLVLDLLFSTLANTEKTGSGRNGFSKIRTALYDAIPVVFHVENAGFLPIRKRS